MGSLKEEGFALLAGLVLVGLVVGFTPPARGRTEGEFDTVLWFTPGESLFGEKSISNFRIDHLQGNLKDYPGKLTTALYWPNTNSILFDTGLALSGDLEVPLIDRTSSELDDINLVLDGYYAEDFGADYPIGTAGGSSRIYFDEEDLDFWVTKGIVNYGGFSYRAVFLLEEIHESSPAILQGVSEKVIFDTKDELSPEARSELRKVRSGELLFREISARTSREILEAIPTEILEKQLGVTSNYGAGLQLALSGMKISGVSVELKTRLGLTPNPGEMVGDDPGSGYDVFNSDGRYIGYTGSDVEIDGIELGPVRVDTTSSFTSDEGFDKTEIDFSLEENSGIFEFDGTITYRPEEKSVSLEPSVDLEWACFDVYSELSPPKLTDEENQLTGININGYGIDEIQLGNVKASFLQALGDNRLQRLQGQDDWRMRASDYDLTTKTQYSYEDRSFVFEETDYEGVLSLEGGGANLELAVDSYWGLGADLFGVTRLTGEAGYRLSNYFELTTGLVIDVVEGVQGLIVNTNYRW